MCLDAFKASGGDKKTVEAKLRAGIPYSTLDNLSQDELR